MIIKFQLVIFSAMRAGLNWTDFNCSKMTEFILENDYLIFFNASSVAGKIKIYYSIKAGKL